MPITQSSEYWLASGNDFSFILQDCMSAMTLRRKTSLVYSFQSIPAGVAYNGQFIFSADDGSSQGFGRAMALQEAQREVKVFINERDVS